MSFGFKKGKPPATAPSLKQQDKAANRNEYAHIPTQDNNGNSGE